MAEILNHSTIQTVEQKFRQGEAVVAVNISKNKKMTQFLLS